VVHSAWYNFYVDVRENVGIPSTIKALDYLLQIFIYFRYQLKFFDTINEFLL